ncbi:hypothetical protein AMATHDRAFT_85772 [Amanita thiersii Skay4041]|uniref:Peptidase S8/S53 domain-containing protein n=1 Tax=Amanita thiersii Skay4041 TaxID=703135 RepID=A0A2A9NRX4_9AGAR|nr:hypothetical protein AMATHDRAFT_85772 [Amanita thiersii Skay4041]
MSLLQWTLLAVSLAASVSASPLSTSPFYPSSHDTPLRFAPFVASDHPHGSVNNSYIIMFKQDTPATLMTNHFNFLQSAHEADPLVDEDLSGISHVYDGHILGYAGKFTDRVIEKIRAMPEVDFVERDQIVKTTDVQRGAPWGLARISHRPKLSFSTFTKYVYNSIAGQGVDVYVIDTGINIRHVEFQGRAKWGKTVPMNDEDEDGNGHGTHCAGTIASRKYGVAKHATVMAVKVLGSNGSGTMSDVVQGVVWAAGQAKAKAIMAAEELARTGRTNHKGSVANMSLGGGKSRALDTAVNRAVDGGLHFAVAAGNDNKDACDYSPAAAENAVTVGASTLGDERAYFSNYGPCVDVFAPGLNILSTYKGSPVATATLSGTSMASPHTAGLLAYLLSVYPSPEFNPTFDEEDNVLSIRSQEAYSPAAFYAFAYSVLPVWISDYMPSPKVVDVLIAPIPKDPKTLTPVQLKKALIALSSEGLLTELPSDTVNKLIFNNATI